ncbi:MAG: VanW family protein [Clostridia bacterium]|nr:VanW family protein [Clostridia bacterium]MDE7328569.1 VanW family protein [Clostridia bacterium]
MKSRIERKDGVIAIILLSAVLALIASGVFLYEFGDTAEGAISPNQYDFSPKMQLISSFSTDFSSSKAERAHNVTLACDSFSWLTVRRGEKLSFNTVVGKRVEERGYKNAKIIVEGKYTEGVGGGVCQVSTTLYNAWIRAGLGSEYAQAHSLPSSYCPLSTDATVSEFIDMVLVNDSDYDVLVNGYTKDGKVVFDIYGNPIEYTIQIRSEVLEVLPEPEPIVEWAEELEGEIKIDDEGEYSISKKGAQGYKSRAVIEYYDKNGVKVKEQQLRSDCYLPVQGMITRKKPPQEQTPKVPTKEDFKWFDMLKNS